MEIHPDDNAINWPQGLKGDVGAAFEKLKTFIQKPPNMQVPEQMQWLKLALEQELKPNNFSVERTREIWTKVNEIAELKLRQFINRSVNTGKP